MPEVDRRGRRLLVLLLAGSWFLRLAYVFAQPGSDPFFRRPILDGAYYLEWARGLVSGQGGVEGAYYLAPFYAHWLAGWFQLLGERLTIVYLLQQACVIGTAALIAWLSSRRGAPWIGIAAAALCLSYHPTIYFASMPIGETPAVLLLVASMALLVARTGLPWALPAGLLLGLAVLGRPNLLLLFPLWGLILLARRQWKRASLLAIGLTLAILPVSWRNQRASGHWVPVSSNAGITLYHGNAPGALGIYTPAYGFSGDLGRQRREATQLARIRSGQELDDVEADRWWGREALRIRLSEPGPTLGLLVRRVLLSLDHYEHALDYPPSLDANPFRFAAPVPFSILLGLAVAGWVAVGFRRSGGAWVWGSVLVCWLTPIIFYVSSRYRFPMAVLLALPAGVGLTVLAGLVPSERRRKRLALLVALIVTMASWAIPFTSLQRAEEAASWANRAAVLTDDGKWERAEAAAREALARDDGSVNGWYHLGLALERLGQPDPAAEAYRSALLHDEGHVESAVNLSRLLIESGLPEQAVPILETALGRRPSHADGWNNLIVALILLEDDEGARRALAQARTIGLEVDQRLAAALEQTAPGKEAR